MQNVGQNSNNLRTVRWKTIVTDKRTIQYF